MQVALDALDALLLGQMLGTLPELFEPDASDFLEDSVTRLGAHPLPLLSELLPRLLVRLFTGLEREDGVAELAGFPAERVGSRPLVDEGAGQAG